MTHVRAWGRGRPNVGMLIMNSAEQALEHLREGNRRFVSGPGDGGVHGHRGRRGDQIVDQRPIAVVLGCSDSRVLPELVFDQGIGDLFVVRVAGNVVTPTQIGSIEFAVERFGTRLVVVLGHSRCGAVEATLDYLRSPGHNVSSNLHSIIDHIRPSVEDLLVSPLAQDRESLSRHAIRAHIGCCANRLRRESGILENLGAEDGLVVVGAEYAMESGVVEFFDEIPISK